MKALGLTGAGLGTVALTAPVFHDLDEVMASNSPGFKHEWWVKERDIMKPTDDIDFSIMTRYNDRTQTQSTGILQNYPSYVANSAANAAAGELQSRRPFLLKSSSGHPHKDRRRSTVQLLPHQWLQGPMSVQD